MKKIMMIICMLAVFGFTAGNAFAQTGVWGTTEVPTTTDSDVEISGDIDVDGSATIGTNAIITGTASIGDDTDIEGDLEIDGALTVEGGIASNYYIGTSAAFSAAWEVEDDEEDTWDLVMYAGKLLPKYPGIQFRATENSVDSSMATFGFFPFGYEVTGYSYVENGALGVISTANSNNVGFFINPTAKEIVFTEEITQHGIYKKINNDSDGMIQNDFDYHHYGNVVTNAGATGSTTFNLPAAVAGMQITFIIAAAQNMDINPDDADQILILTDSAGDAIRCNQVGANITLTAIDATNWVMTASQGTWNDVN